MGYSPTVMSLILTLSTFAAVGLCCFCSYLLERRVCLIRWVFDSRVCICRNYDIEEPLLVN